MTATQRPRRDGALPARPGVQPRPQPRPSSPLRIVPPGELSPQGLRRRRRLVTVAAAGILTLGLLGVAVVHVILAQQQFELASLQTRTAAAQSANEELKLEVAQLQSPSRIVSAAQEKLGMVPPPSIAYLAPGGHASQVRAPSAPAVPAPTPAPAPSAGSGSGPAQQAGAGGSPVHPASSSAP